jgi:hypothetical protein
METVMFLNSPALAPEAELFAAIAQKLSGRCLGMTPKLRLKLEDGRVTIHGQLRTYYERQLIVHAIREVAGVRGIHDRLEVVTPSEDPMPPHDRYTIQADDGDCRAGGLPTGVGLQSQCSHFS